MSKIDVHSGQTWEVNTFPEDTVSKTPEISKIRITKHDYGSGYCWYRFVYSDSLGKREYPIRMVDLKAQGTLVSNVPTEDIGYSEGAD